MGFKHLQLLGLYIIWKFNVTRIKLSGFVLRFSSEQYFQAVLIHFHTNYVYSLKYQLHYYILSYDVKKYERDL